MAFDGITTAALTRELSDRLTGGRIFRIIQPENDELLITVKPMIEKGGGTVKLVLSADPSLPLVYLTDNSVMAPQSAPTFCMLLRKYLQNGRITRISQPGLERIIRIEIEHLNEMGDLCHHVLVIEIMGKHSNIILLAPTAEGNAATFAALPENSAFAAYNGGPSHGAKLVREGEGEYVIIDAIRHVSQMVSSVREVLPGRPYFIPETQGKRNPFTETRENFCSLLSSAGIPAPAFLVRSYTGFSNVTAEEVTFRTHLGQDRSVSEFSKEERELFWETFQALLLDVQEGRFAPTVYYHLGKAATMSLGEPVEYAAMTLSMYKDLPDKQYGSISSLLESYYREKNTVTRIRQKSTDLRKIVTTLLERDVHKYDLQMRQLRDTKKRDKYRVYGELLNAYGYNIPEGTSSAVLDNYYTGEKLTVPLDPTKTPQQNARRYFDRYTKLKRTEEALTHLTAEVRTEIDELESIKTALDLSQTDGDLIQIRREMEDAGFVRRKTDSLSHKQTKSRTPESRPLHYVSSDGYDILVGKNNTQNDELTFHTAAPTDIWFHANEIPGSHVVLRTEGKPFEQIPDRAFEEAASLAAYWSRGRDAGRVEVDYLEKRGVKKPAGARPGFVIYHSNYSINVDAVIPVGVRQESE
jgi:predicted ribosome quality control (RQC) complex YloA/Tae2 family protein